MGGEILKSTLFYSEKVDQAAQNALQLIQEDIDRNDPGRLKEQIFDSKHQIQSHSLWKYEVDKCISATLKATLGYIQRTQRLGEKVIQKLKHNDTLSGNVSDTREETNFMLENQVLQSLDQKFKGIKNLNGANIYDGDNSIRQSLAKEEGRKKVDLDDFLTLETIEGYEGIESPDEDEINIEDPMEYIDTNDLSNPPSLKYTDYEDQWDHKDKTTYLCEECSYVTTVKKYLRKHKSRNHNLNCKSCKESQFKDKEDLRKHVETKHTKKNVDNQKECDFGCGFSHQHRSRLERHMKRMHQIGEFKCIYCSLVMSTKHDIQEHALSAHKKNRHQYNMDICRKAN